VKMFALPSKENLSADMVKDLSKNLRPGMRFLDVAQYMRYRFGKGAYTISPAPPVRPVRFVRSRR
jgi:hypothetical protein